MLARLKRFTFAITAETDLLNEGYADSLTLMQILLEVERRFQCSIPPTRISSGKITSAMRIAKILEEVNATLSASAGV